MSEFSSWDGVEVEELEKGTLEGMLRTVARFSVKEGDGKVPILILRSPVDKAFCTREITKHWFDGAEDSRAIIPCGRSEALKAATGGVCPVCDVREEYERTCGLNTLPQPAQDGLRGSFGQETQVIDFRGHLDLLTRFASSNGSPQVLAEIHTMLANATPLRWSMTRAVAAAIVNLCLAPSRPGLPTIGDVSNPRGARILYVAKEKPSNGKGMPRFVVTPAYSMPPIPLYPELFNSGRIFSYADIEKDAVEYLSVWPATRVMEILGNNGIATGGNLRMIGPGSVQRPALPPAVPVAPPVPYQPVPAPAALQPRVIEAKVVQAPPVPVAPGDTVGAQDLSCFGTTPNLKDEKCVRCPRMSECMSAAVKAFAKPTAPALATLPTPPAEDANSVKARVAAALGGFNKK